MARTKNHCPHCGEDNGAKGNFCPRCGKLYVDQPVDSDLNSPATADANVKKTEPKEKTKNIKEKILGGFIMDRNTSIIAGLTVIVLALILGLSWFLTIGIWGTLAIFALGIIAISLLVALFFPKVENWKSGLRLGIALLIICLVVGIVQGNLFNNKTTTINGDLHVKGSIVADKDVTADKVVANQVDADTVIANKVKANKVEAKEIVVEKITVTKVPVVVPNTPKPRPTLAPTTIPEVTIAPKVNLAQHFTGDFIAPADGIVSGDCSLNGRILYDNSEKTFLVFSVKKGDKLNCQWVAYFDNIVSFDEMTQRAAADNSGQSKQ